MDSAATESGTHAQAGRARGAALAVVLGATFTGTAGVAQALGRTALSPFAIGASRILVGTLVLLLFAGFSAGGLSVVWSCFGRRTLPALLAAGGAIAVYQVCYFNAVIRTGVAVGSVVTIALAPVFTALAARVVLGEHLTRRWVVGTAGAVLGCALIVLPGKDIQVDLFGFVLAVVAAVAQGVSLVAVKRLLTERPPLAALTAMALVAAVMLCPVAFMAAPQLLNPRALATVLWLGLFTMALGYRLFVRGLQELPASTVATLGLAEPMAAVILSLLVLGERFGLVVGAGMLLLLAALVFLAAPRRTGAGATRLQGNTADL